MNSTQLTSCVSSRNGSIRPSEPSTSDGKTASASTSWCLWISKMKYMGIAEEDESIKGRDKKTRQNLNVRAGVGEDIDIFIDKENGDKLL
jgi:hypothetical protein